MKGNHSLVGSLISLTISNSISFDVYAYIFDADSYFVICLLNLSLTMCFKLIGINIIWFFFNTDN
jgi:hypothetical protein